MEPKIEIRGFQLSDEAAVRDISCETAFLGEPIDKILDCRELVADLLTYYYLHFEPESCFVAEDRERGRVIGYLLGAVDTKRSNEITAKKVYPSIFKNFILRRYKIGEKEISYIWGFILSSLRGEIPKPDLVRYPAHLHINILKPYRRRGIGTGLMLKFQDYLLARGIKGIHLLTTSLHKEAIPFYERMGFELRERIETKMWRKVFGEMKVENLLFVKSLA